MFHLMVTADSQLLKSSLSMLVQSPLLLPLMISAAPFLITSRIILIIDELATCTAAADWRIGDNFINKISILRQYPSTIYNPKKNYIDGCSRPDWFIDQWFSLVGKQFNFSTLLFLDDLAIPDGGGFVARPPVHIDANGLFDIQYDNTASQNLHPSTENNRHNILYCVFVDGPHYMWLRPK